MRSVKVSISFKHWNKESCSLLKKNNLEEFIEENIPKPKEDEDKQKGHLALVYRLQQW